MKETILELKRQKYTPCVYVDTTVFDVKSEWFIDLNDKAKEHELPFYTEKTIEEIKIRKGLYVWRYGYLSSFLENRIKKANGKVLPGIL